MSYGAAISASEKSILWEIVVGSMHTVLASLLQPDVLGCNAAISACEKSAQWEKALG